MWRRIGYIPLWGFQYRARIRVAYIQAQVLSLVTREWFQSSCIILALVNPVFEGVVNHAIQVREVAAHLQVQEYLDERAAEARHVKLPFSRCCIPLSLRICERRGGRVREVHAPSIGIMQSLEDLLPEGYALCGHGSVLGRSSRREGTRDARGTVTGRAESGRVVVVSSTQVSPGDDAIDPAVYGIAGCDCGIDDFLKLTRRREVVERLFDDVRVQVLHLLEGEHECRSFDRGPVKLIRETLRLTPALSTSLGAALIVRIQLGRLGHVEEGLREAFTQLAHLVDRFVPEHVDVMPIAGPVSHEEPSVSPATAPYISPPGRDLFPELMAYPPPSVDRYRFWKFSGVVSQYVTTTESLSPSRE